MATSNVTQLRRVHLVSVGYGGGRELELAPRLRARADGAQQALQRCIADIDPLDARGPDGCVLLEAFTRGWTPLQRRAVSLAITRGVGDGDTVSRMVRAIRGSREQNYADRLVDVSTKQAEAIVRSASRFLLTYVRTFDWD